MKNSYLTLLLIWAGLGFWTGCDGNAPLPDETSIVVRAYLYEGEPVKDIQLTTSVAISDSSTTAPAISDAKVTLLRGNTRFLLSPTPNQAGYYHYSGNDLQIQAGETYNLEVVYNGKTLTATTTVPPKPTGVSQSAKVYNVSITTIQTPFGTRTNVNSTDSLVVYYENTAANYYYFVVESIEANAMPLRTVPQSPDGRIFPIRRFISDPSTGQQYRVPLPQINYAGAHRVLVYRINKEYADLYKSRSQDSRNLTEPLTNIKGGLGVFSAFSATPIYFNVKISS